MDIKSALDLPFETPHMVIDSDLVNANISRMQELANQNNKRLRPHSKTHKIPELSRLQIDSGAVGVCVQKVSEAEVMFKGGIENLLLSNEVIGEKLRRCSVLISEGANLTVVVDNVFSAKQFSSLCEYAGIDGRVMIDVNIGMNRCGVDPSEFSSLLKHILKMPNILFEGIMAYDGHVSFQELKKRNKEVNREEETLSRIVHELEKNRLRDMIVSVGGTPTAEIWAHSELVNELQPGTYVYYDMHCVELGLCALDDVAIGVVATATSEKRGARVVLDAGYKSVSLDQGVYPTVIDENENEYSVLSMSEEHTVLKVSKSASYLGKKFIMLPYHSCTTTDLWDNTYAISRTRRPRQVIIEGRGKRE